MQAHRHGIVLAMPLFRAFLLALGGAACFLAPWPTAVAGAALLAVAAVLAVLAVARWDRTHLVVTPQGISVVYGLLRRRKASVTIEEGSVVEVERTLLGRLLGYGTVVAGELAIDAVPKRLHEHLFGG